MVGAILPKIEYDRLMTNASFCKLEIVQSMLPRKKRPPRVRVAVGTGASHYASERALDAVVGKFGRRAKRQRDHLKWQFAANKPARSLCAALQRMNAARQAIRAVRV